SLLLGELVAFFSLINYIIGPLMNLGYIINQFSQAKASGERLLEILDAEEDIVNHDEAITVDRIEGQIKFDQVTLKYTDDDDPALKNITFEVPKGHVVGLIGATGAGKTSITQLLARFYEPNEGSVYIDGRLTTDYDL